MASGPEEGSAEAVLADYGRGYLETKDRLVDLIAGFEREGREAGQRVEQLELSSEVLRYHLERMDAVQTTGLSRPAMIREFERGLVVLDEAEQDLESELARASFHRQREAGDGGKPALPLRLLRGLVFLLPLLIFLTVALILISTALGWF